MPRKKLIYTHLFPYHVVARSNNKDWFYLNKSETWRIMVQAAISVTKKYQLLIHAFVLMDNHYHMVVTTHPDHPLGEVMCKFQKTISRKINKKTNRINHVFGGPSKPSLISNPEYYARVIKYVYQNPIRAGICKEAEHYAYSSLNSDEFRICSPFTGIAHLVPTTDFHSWINSLDNSHEEVRKGLKKTVFKVVKTRSY